MEQGQNFSDDLQQNLRMENESLKIKLRAQYGEAFEMEINEGMPPEMENQFLKSMIALEEEYANTEFTTVYERIGKPAFKPLNELSKLELRTATGELIKILEKHEIGLDICDGPYPDELIYQFITGELFDIKVEKNPVAGLPTNFIYEEFYPNHKADIEKRAHTFLNNWFHRKFTESCAELSWHCVTPAGEQMTREDIIGKMKVFFEAFLQFKSKDYSLNGASFELQEDTEGGIGFAEGILKYDAVIEDGDIIHYEGPYKIYLHLEDKWWSIFYFEMPGFKW